MIRRLLSHPLLTLAGNALTIWTVSAFLLTAGVIGGVVWAFSSFPLVFQVLTLAGALGLGLLALAFTAPLMGTVFAGIQLSMRSSIFLVAIDRPLSGPMTPDGLTRPESASFATVLVMNRREKGGSSAVARRITPQVEIFEHDGTRLFNHVGWDIGSERDFRPTREEHRLFIAGKWKDDEDFFAVAGRPPDGGVGKRRMVGQTYDVKITLRGENLRQPISANFLLANQGVSHHLSLSKT